MTKNKNVIEAMKDELGQQIMKKFVGLRPRTYSHLKDNDDDYKKAKGTKRCVMKTKLKFHNCKSCFKACQFINTVNYLERQGINFNRLKTNS